MTGAAPSLIWISRRARAAGPSREVQAIDDPGGGDEIARVFDNAAARESGRLGTAEKGIESGFELHQLTCRVSGREHSEPAPLTRPIPAS